MIHSMANPLGCSRIHSSLLLLFAGHHWRMINQVKNISGIHVFTDINALPVFLPQVSRD